MVLTDPSSEVHRSWRATMATPSGIAAAARQAASGYALRALPRPKTYTTSWDINKQLRFWHRCLR